MGTSVRFSYLAPILVLLLAGCGEKLLELSSSNANSISGKVSIPSAISSLEESNQSCTTFAVSIYKVDANGFKAGEALATTETDDAGQFSFKSLTALGVDTKAERLGYMIEARSCSGGLFSRPLAGDNKAQNISLSGDLIQRTLQVASLQGKDVLQLNRANISQFNERLDALGSDNFLNLY
ncbi:MAG: hypothetical protein EOP09_20815, partial [Proteobacteria bacterium]